MINIVDLFCGAGGSAIGVERIKNTNTLLAIDFWDKAVKSYNDNLKHKVAEMMDITKVDKKWLDDRLHEQTVDIVMGGPPCQGFSSTTRHKWKNGTNKDMKEKNYLFKSFLNIVYILKPKLVIMENVKGILTIKNEFGEKIIDEIVKAYNEIGYYVKYQIVYIDSLGLPQHRDRVIFFASKDEELLKELKYPNKNKFKNNCIFGAIMDIPNDINNKDYCMQKNDCTKYIKSLRRENSKLTNHIIVKQKDRTIERIKQILPGKCMKDLDDDNSYKTKGKFNNSYLRQNNMDLLVTQINIAKNILIHPQEDRIYSVRESLRLQNFPDTYKFDEKSIKPKDMYQMVANAIPPILMEEIFKVNIEIINNICAKKLKIFQKKRMIGKDKHKKGG